MLNPDRVSDCDQNAGCTCLAIVSSVLTVSALYPRHFAVNDALESDSIMGTGGEAENMFRKEPKLSGGSVALFPKWLPLRVCRMRLNQRSTGI